MQAALLLLSCLVIAGQTQPPRDTSAVRQAGTAVLRGRVVTAATGQPLHRVRLVMNGQAANPPSAVTDTRGEFEITNIPAGSYTLSASRAGYLTIQYGQRRPQEAGRTIEVRTGEVIDNVALALPRAAVLAGLITDDAGEPYPGVRVEAIEFRYLRGRRVAVQAAAATTNDIGQFRVAGLAPGSYQLRASSYDTWDNDDSQSLTYAVTYYPGVTSDQAETISVAVGQEVANLNFGLRAGRAARITGTVQNAAGEPLALEPVTLSRTIRGVGGALFASGSAGATRTDKTGAFELNSLPPGEYLVNAGAEDQRASVNVMLADGDVRHVAVMPRPPTTLFGSIVNDENVPMPFPATRVRITAILADPETLFQPWASPGTVNVAADWGVRFNNADGQFLFRVAGLPDEWMLADVRYAGKSTIDAPLTIGAGTSDRLQLVLSRKGGKINGQVTTLDGSPAADSTVVIFALDSTRWTLASRFVRSARPDNAGKFAIGGLPAGVYGAVARDFIVDGQWEDPAFLNSLRDTATRVELTEGGMQTIALKLEPPR